MIQQTLSPQLTCLALSHLLVLTSFTVSLLAQEVSIPDTGLNAAAARPYKEDGRRAVATPR